jgi:NAD(P)H-dependent flavin oxidoreductase YrpB (nitropropane dioxygenase family)
MALALGADAVWVGTRFICAEEAGAPKHHQEAVLNAGYHDTVRTIIYTGACAAACRPPPSCRAAQHVACGLGGTVRKECTHECIW